MPAALIRELTPCLQGSFCGNPRAPGLHEPVVIKVDTPEPTTPAPAPRRSSTASVCTQELEFDIQEVAVPELDPKQPTSLDEISVLYSDDWTTGCVPEMPRVDVNGSAIEVTTTGDTGFCTFLFAAYELDFKLGPLPADEYRINIVDRRGETQTEIATFGFTVRNPQPEIASLQPDVIAAASGDQELQVNGSGFIEDASAVHWDGGPLETTFVSNTSLTALVPASSLEDEGTATVTVVSDDPVETRISNAVELLIETPELELTELTPPSVPTGADDTLIELSGDGFRPDSTVEWTGSFGAEGVLDSTYVDRNTMTVVLPANELRTAATHLLAVTRDDETTDPLSFKVVGEASTPVAIVQAAVHAASFQDGVAPGSIGTIFGVNLATATIEADRFPIATELGGARVLINGLEAPILFASENQINFQAPFELTPGPASVSVEREGVAGPTAGMTVVADSFGAFQYNRVAEVRDLVVIHQDGSVVTPDSPARRGETVTLFGTGIASLTNPPATGEPAAASPLSQCTASPQAAITGLGGGELPVAVTFCGLTPGFAGLVQLNLTMPNEPMAGANSMLFLAFDGKLLSYAFATE